MIGNGSGLLPGANPLENISAIDRYCRMLLKGDGDRKRKVTNYCGVREVVSLERISCTAILG